MRPPIKSLLLVDPDDRRRRVLEVCLRNAGLWVHTAADPLRAFEQLSLDLPAIVVCAHRPPALDGLALCTKMREMSPAAQEVAFVLLAEGRDHRLAEQALNANVDEVLLRPIYVQELLTRLAVLFQRRQRARLANPKNEVVLGELSELSPIDLLQILGHAQATGLLELPGRRPIHLWFEGGELLDAQAGQHVGEEAVYLLLTHQRGQFSFKREPVERSQRVLLSVEALISEGAARLESWQQALEQLPSLGTVFAVDAPTRAQYSELLPEAILNLLQLVDGQRTIMHVVEDSPLPAVDTLVSLARLYAEGLLYPDWRASESSNTASYAQRDLSSWLAEARLGAHRPRWPQQNLEVSSTGLAAMGLVLGPPPPRAFTQGLPSLRTQPPFAAPPVSVPAPPPPALAPVPAPALAPQGLPEPFGAPKFTTIATLGEPPQPTDEAPPLPVPPWVHTGAPAPAEAPAAQSAPVRDKTAPVRGEAAPVRDEAAPVRDQAAPARDQAAPVRDQAAPARDQAAPVRDEAAPVRDEAAPIRDEAAPVRDEAAPVREKPAPARDEAAPSTAARSDLAESPREHAFFATGDDDLGLGDESFRPSSRGPLITLGLLITVALAGSFYFFGRDTVTPRPPAADALRADWHSALIAQRPEVKAPLDLEAAPAEEAPADAPPTEEAPADAPPTEEAPADAPPAEEAPADALSPEQTAQLSALIDEAQAHHAAERFSQAAERAQAALQIDAHSEPALAVLALAQLDQGNEDQAFEAAERLAERHPDNAQAQLILGIIHQNRGDLAAARQAYERNLRLQPQGPHAMELRQVLEGMP